MTQKQLDKRLDKVLLNYNQMKHAFQVVCQVLGYDGSSLNPYALELKNQINVHFQAMQSIVDAQNPPITPEDILALLEDFNGTDEERQTILELLNQFFTQDQE